MAGIGANIFAGGGASTSVSPPTVANSSTMFGPPSSTGGAGPFSPRHGFGLGFWLAAGGLVALVAIRQSLPR